MCEVLSMHHNLPAASFDPAMIRLAVARSLPAHLIEQYKVVPVGITRGVMRLASPEVPSDRLQRELKLLTQLETEFVLIPPDNFRMLCERLLWEHTAAREEKAMAAGAGSGAAV
jgi:hypothetical protein